MRMALALALCLLGGQGPSSLAAPLPADAARDGHRHAMAPLADYRRDALPLALRNPPIVWRDINILHLTDVHSFIAGNRHEGVDVDYGDLTSFVRHLHDLADVRGVDLFVLNTGDLVDGTGMSDATPVAGEFLAPILQRIPYDGLTIGNHELYEDSTVDNLRDSGFLGAFGERVVTSNQRYAASGAPIGGSQATVLEGRNGARLLAFGFLFDFTGTSPGTHVERVADVVLEPWFAEAAAHADTVDGIVISKYTGNHSWIKQATECLGPIKRRDAVLKGACDYSGAHGLVRQRHRDHPLGDPRGGAGHRRGAPDDLPRRPHTHPDLPPIGRTRGSAGVRAIFRLHRIDLVHSDRAADLV